MYAITCEKKLEKCLFSANQATDFFMSLNLLLQVAWLKQYISLSVLNKWLLRILTKQKKISKIK
jgi:hypothetical protein